MSTIFYILLLCGLVCSSCCVSFARDKFLVKFFQGITFLILFLPAAFRYGIGVDYFNYVTIFDNISRGGEFSKEPIWWVLNRFVYELGGDARVLIALVAFLTYYFMFCEVISKKWFIYVPVFFLIIYTWTFTTLRQMLAMSMCFFSLCRVQKGKYFLAFVVFILSFFVHRSVLFYILIYGIVKMVRVKKRIGIIFVFAIYIIAVMLGPLLNDIFLMIVSLTLYGSDYINSDWVNAPEISTGLGRLLKSCIYFALVIFFPKKNEKSELFTLLLLYISIEFFSQNIRIIGRVGRGVIFLFLPLAWNVFQERKKSDIPFWVYCCCFLLLFLLDLVGGFHGSVPYESIF